MSLDYHFHVEARLDGRWQIPSALPKRPHFKPGEFVWFPRAAVARHLFFGTQALFSVAPGTPAVVTDSELYQYVGESYDLTSDEKQISWLAYDEFFVDLWPHEQALVSGKIEARFASLFWRWRIAVPATQPHGKTGSQTGASPTCAILESLLLVRSIGAPANAATSWQTTRPVIRCPSSWKDSVAGCLGEDFVLAFQGLRLLGADADLRVVSTLS
jgi:hypothetical protein